MLPTSSPVGDQTKSKEFYAGVLGGTAVQESGTLGRASPQAAEKLTSRSLEGLEGLLGMTEI